MAQLIARWDGAGVNHLHEAMLSLGRDVAGDVWRRALNHTASKSKTLVIRTVAKQAGVSQSVIRKRRAIYLRKANRSDLQAYIIAQDNPMTLKDFRPTQLKAGVKAGPWGVRRVFKSTFIVEKLGGNVFKRSSKKRFPIEKLYGPAIPTEMMRPETTQPWQRLVEVDLPRRMEHELHRITGHVFR